MHNSQIFFLKFLQYEEKELKCILHKESNFLNFQIYVLLKVYVHSLNIVNKQIYYILNNIHILVEHFHIRIFLLLSNFPYIFLNIHLMKFHHYDYFHSYIILLIHYLCDLIEEYILNYILDILIYFLKKILILLD